MTKYEKVSTFLSIAALISAVLSPFISYWWLDPQLQGFKNRPSLQVSLEERKGGGVSVDMADPNYSILTTGAGPCTVSIVNTGDLPARDVTITVHFLEMHELEKPPVLDPPYLVDTSSRQNIQFITLKQPIAPHNVVRVTFDYQPKLIWVSTEFGDTSTIITGANAFRINENTNEVTPLDFVAPKPSPTIEAKEKRR